MTDCASPERRIDITLSRIASIYHELSAEQRREIERQRFWSIILIVFQLRAMERGEEAYGYPVQGLADIYDRLISPGEDAFDAILRCYNEGYGGIASKPHREK